MSTWCPFGTKAGRDMRLRTRHCLAGRDAQAGLDPQLVHPPTLRHSFAHSLTAAGASDEDVQRLGRWRDSKMVRGNGAALSQQRACETHRRLSARTSQRGCAFAYPREAPALRPGSDDHRG
jgi:integrase